MQPCPHFITTSVFKVWLGKEEELKNLNDSDTILAQRDLPDKDLQGQAIHEDSRGSHGGPHDFMRAIGVRKQRRALGREQCGHPSALRQVGVRCVYRGPDGPAQSIPGHWHRTTRRSCRTEGCASGRQRNSGQGDAC